MRHLLPLLLELLSLAFAPAPFPKTRDRAGADRVTEQALQGTWKVVSIEVVEQSGGRKAIPWVITHVRVEGDRFFEAQSEAWRTMEGAPKHYRFITGAGCLDVISNAMPRFVVTTI